METENKETLRPKRIVIVDDHPMIREALGGYVNATPSMSVCGQAGNIEEAHRVIRETNPDLAIVDLSLKEASGLELIKDLRQQRPTLRVLVFTMHEEAIYAERAIRAGAKGYITKDEPSENILAAIRRVLSGQIHLSQDAASRILKSLSSGRSRTSTGPIISRLTDRELEIFRLIGHGRPTRQIAGMLHLGIKTVDTYRTRIKAKLSLQNAAELNREAVRWVQEQE